MSYQSQSLLMGDPLFNGRSNAVAIQQADSYINDQRPNFVAVANSVLRGESTSVNAFVRLNAAGPGIADKAENADGSIDQSRITDADLLSLTQANWQVVAGLFYNEDGSPLT